MKIPIPYLSSSEAAHKNGKCYGCPSTKRNESSICQSFPSRQSIVQPKLELTTPGDSYEREADRMADFVMRKTYSGLPTKMPSAASVVHPTISGSVSGSAGVVVDTATEGGINASRGGGQPMPEALRSQMESGFGADFSGVRLHTDSKAADLSRSLQAKTFTYGNDIFFNSGQYQPHSAAGQRLIAHELTHVVQQSGKVGREGDDYFCLGDRRIKEALYFISNPIDALTVGHPKYDGLSKTATDFSINIARAASLTYGKEGDERNAVRHVLWQALITKTLGEEEAIKIADAHENGCNPTRDHDESVTEYRSLEDADKAADLSNNAIGRKIGKNFPEANNKEIAEGVMNEYYRNGLWVVVKVKEDKYVVEKQKLSECQLRLAVDEIGKKDEFGLNRKDNINNNKSANIGCFCYSKPNPMTYIDELIEKQNSCTINPTILDRFFEFVAAMQNRMNETEIEKGKQEEQAIPNPIELSKYNRNERAIFLFGDKSGDAEKGKRIYNNKKEAEGVMVKIDVDAWKEKESGEKIGYKLSLRVHKKLAPMIMQIFNKIYNHSDKFVILDAEMDFRIAPDEVKKKAEKKGKGFKGVGAAAFNWRYDRYKEGDEKLMAFSEHAAGVAIDINSRYNPFLEGANPYEAGHKNTEYGGKYDKYTIKSSSSVVEIFKRYGWSWGGNWSNKKDYMHFEWFSKTFPRR